MKYILFKFSFALMFFISPASFGSFENYTKEECPVVGNIQSQIYHVPGGRFYKMMLQKNKRADNRRCFQTQSEAVKAGFRKSQR